jgi:DNA-binding transcriptional MerR regulator
MRAIRKANQTLTMKVWRTSDMAKVGGVHVNTVRLYEDLGYLPPVPRNPANNYRQFTDRHLDQMRVIRLALRISWLGGTIGQMCVEVIRLAALDDLPGALDRARDLATRVQAERDQAEAAAAALEAWAQNIPHPPTPSPSLERGRQAHKPNSRRDGACSARPYKTHTEKGVFTIGQAADLLDVSVDMLRNWERNGLISGIPRDPRNNYRRYGPAQIARLRVIRALRRARYSTMSILRMLRHLDAGHTDGLREKLDTPHPDDDVYTATDYWLTTVTALVQAARDLVAQIENMVESS